MPKGASIAFLRDKLFPLCFMSFSQCIWMLGIRVCDGGMMKLKRGLVSDKVWQSYVLCGVHIRNFEKWRCGVLLWFCIDIVHLMAWVILKNSIKDWRVMFGKPLEDCIICPSASSQEFVPLLYVVRIVGVIYIFEIWEFVLSCQTLFIEAHERNIKVIWPLRLIDLQE